MKFRVESGELSLDHEALNAHDAAVGTLKVWHAAEERICLNGVLTAKQLGPRGGVQNEKMFSTANLLKEINIEYITKDGHVITLPGHRPTIVKSDIIAAGKWIALQRTTYKWDDEPERKWEYVTRPTRKGKHDAVVVVPFLKNPNRLVVIREFRVPINDYEIGFCAGLIDGQESAEDAARRELREETGLEMTKVLKVSPPLFSSPGMTDENVVMIFCECDGEPNGVSTPDEKIEVISLDLEGVESVLENSPCSMSQKLWPILQMMSSQGYIGWKEKQ